MLSFTDLWEHLCDINAELSEMHMYYGFIEELFQRLIRFIVKL